MTVFALLFEQTQQYRSKIYFSMCKFGGKTLGKQKLLETKLWPRIYCTSFVYIHKLGMNFSKEVSPTITAERVCHTYSNHQQYGSWSLNGSNSSNAVGYYFHMWLRYICLDGFIQDLGLFLDPALQMAKHIAIVARNGLFQLHLVWKPRLL